MMILNKRIGIVLLALCLLVCSYPAVAQQPEVSTEGMAKNPDWTKPYPPFKIAGNLYYVGTYDIACYLIKTKKGLILINAGLKETVPLIIQNVEALGFDFKDIKILLTNQVRYELVGGMTIIKRFTGARLMVDSLEGKLMADGGTSDFLYGSDVSLFDPVEPDRLLIDQDIIRLGRTKIMMLHHPGNSKGSCSFLFTLKAKGRKYKVLIANMPKVQNKMNFVHRTKYPDIVKDFGYTFKAMRQLQFDLWLAPYASQFGLHEKRKSQYEYNPDAFIDRAGYDKMLDELQEEYKRKLDMMH